MDMQGDSSAQVAQTWPLPVLLAAVFVCIVLTISASHELIEWGAALALGQCADGFLGTQGDPWDTQSDMAFALLGDPTTLVLSARLHDRQMAGLPRRGAGDRA